jgi:uncharacterized protein YbbK (DUF523 family)
MEPMKLFKDLVLVSRCCAGAECRYNGKGYFKKVVKQIARRTDFIAACPELLGGLATPREGVNIVDGRAIGRQTGADYTKEYLAGARATLALCRAHNITTAYLLARSPSCGKGYGLTAKLLEAHGVRVIPI